MYGYAGYFDGPYKNVAKVKARFPGKPVMGYSVRQATMQGGDAIDMEPGTVGQTFEQCAPVGLAFIRNWKGGSGLFNLPLVYFFASWQTKMEDYFAAHGLKAGVHYYINSSHATGVAHFCGPHTPGCGFGRTQASMTQYKFAGSYDKTVMQSYMLRGNAPPAKPPVQTDGALLQNGDEGDAVRHVQQRLFNLKYLTDDRQCDGQFGPVTELAVQAFQRAAGFPPAGQDGIVGPKTWAALPKNIVNPAYKPPPKPTPRPPLPPATLKRGNKSTAVKALQWYLANSGLKGVRGIDQDGFYGEQTETAVRNFQGYSKLATDGIYGKDTRTALAKVRID